MGDIDTEVLEEIPDTILLEDGFYALEKALESLQEMKSAEGNAIAYMVFSAMRYAEEYMLKIGE